METSRTTGKINLPPLAQIGIVVKDIDKVIEFYSSAFGIGPWEIRDGGSEVKVGGQIYQYETKLAFANFGPITFELIEVKKGGSPVYSGFLDKNREGVHHLGFHVSKEEKEQMIADLAKIGVGVFQEGRTKRDAHVVFLDTESIGGVFFELIHRPTK
jgi:catechol 2,3-dioxygenase-like lactoylglutathione lyase family enzyme